MKSDSSLQSTMDDTRHAEMRLLKSNDKLKYLKDDITILETNIRGIFTARFPSTLWFTICPGGCIYFPVTRFQSAYIRGRILLHRSHHNHSRTRTLGHPEQDLLTRSRSFRRQPRAPLAISRSLSPEKKAVLSKCERELVWKCCLKYYSSVSLKGGCYHRICNHNRTFW